VPELRIVDDGLWQAVRARQAEIAEQYANVTGAVREHHERNRLSGTRRPRSLLSGMIFCGCCGGPYSLRGADRFACSNHIGKGTCSNGRTIPRAELESRVLAGLEDRMMSPEVAAEAMRAYAEETNRLNRVRRVNSDAWKAELGKVEKEIRGIIEAIKAGMFQAGMKAEMDALQARKAELTRALTDTRQDVPDVLPTASKVYARKVAKLTEALNEPEERPHASEVLRMLIEKIVLTPGPERGAIDALLYGDLGTILNWVGRVSEAGGRNAGAHNANTPSAFASGVSVSVVAGACNHLKLRLLSAYRSLLERSALAKSRGLLRSAA